MGRGERGAVNGRLTVIVLRIDVVAPGDQLLEDGEVDVT